MEALKLRDMVRLLDEWYPPHLAEPWDSVGLIVGDLDAPIRKIMVALDPVEDTVEQALAYGADLLVTHHPLFLKPVHQVSSGTYKGALVHRLIRGGCALFNAHTNADRAAGGVADSLAEALGLVDVRPLDPATTDARHLWSVYVPVRDTELVTAAMARAGAGQIGEYSNCSWHTAGVGTFTASTAASPAIGAPGQTTQVAESRVEMIADAALRSRIEAALRDAHPYEEPAFTVTEVVPQDSGLGLGRIGRVPVPMTLGDFARHVAAALPATAQGIRAAGDLDALISTVAAVGGSGDSMIALAERAGADVYVTSDLRHHPTSEARERAHGGKPFLIDTAHFASESVWLPRLAERLRAHAARGAGAPLFEVAHCEVRTDPWTTVFPSV
ncbi:Nif3-like dinuclear metal center hexameric protein [Rarobacter incanus]|uniref:GTP cyclohydrolase 1 type 2 homolog n=1 Tax=Rarobacter incanus TaxID=153494 RepID=A0A542SMM5_9MICO|nr:Nif3-like dinuclear metal center hexameric protein [Rarobacter incanus]TQK75872.1 dinuclear metal center YbgI/SA1388 family protein [Rarobacter incanus]